MFYFSKRISKYHPTITLCFTYIPMTQVNVNRACLLKTVPITVRLAIRSFVAIFL